MDQPDRLHPSMGRVAEPAGGLGEGTDVGEEVLYTSPPVLIGLENLRAVKHAFLVMKLSDSEIQDFFWNKATRILGIRT